MMKHNSFNNAHSVLDGPKVGHQVFFQAPRDGQNSSSNIENRPQETKNKDTLA